MTRTVEYMLSCITEHFYPNGVHHKAKIDTRRFSIIKNSFYYIISEWLDNNEIHILLNDKNLLKASNHLKYFVEFQKGFLFNRELSWTRILILFTRYIQVVKRINDRGQDIEPYLFEMYNIMRCSNVNIWIFRKSMHWHDFMAYFLDNNCREEVFRCCLLSIKISEKGNLYFMYLLP